MKRTILALGITLALAGLLSGVAFAQADVPTYITAYSGTWEGQWSATSRFRAQGNVSSTVKVGQFVKDANVYTAPVTYTWVFNSGKTETMDTKGVVVEPDGGLLITLARGSSVEFRFSDSKSLKGVWHHVSGVGQMQAIPGTFEKK
jgi:hypothetical protein